MRTSLLLAAIILLFAASSQAAWVELNNIQSGGRLMGDGNDLYYLVGTDLKKYDAATDAWTSVASCPVLANRRAYIGDNKIAISTHSDGNLYIYDISDNTWTTTSGAPIDQGWWNNQGMYYDPVNDKIVVSWSDSLTGYPDETFYSAIYDPNTGSWSDRYLYRPSGAEDPVFVGDNVYSNITNCGGPEGALRFYDATQIGDFGLGTWSTTSSFDLANDNSAYDQLGKPGADTTAFTKMMAVWGDKIYITGADWSNCFIIYDTSTDTWIYPQEYFPEDIGGYRDHSVQVANGILYMQQSGKLYAYDLNPIPEPGMITLVLLGVAGLVSTRHRR